MLIRLVLELVGSLLIRFSSAELVELLGLVGRELRLRSDVCASNHVQRAHAAHVQFLAEHPTRVRSALTGNADSEGGC